jgi:hypothetical protein
MMTWYDDAMRTIIELTDGQLAALAELCEREKISRAEAIRRAVDALLCRESERTSQRRTAIEAAFGMWKDRGIDAETYLATLRAEWDREWDPR